MRFFFWVRRALGSVLDDALVLVSVFVGFGFDHCEGASINEIDEAAHNGLIGAALSRRILLLRHLLVFAFLRRSLPRLLDHVLLLPIPFFHCCAVLDLALFIFLTLLFLFANLSLLVSGTRRLRRVTVILFAGLFRDLLVAFTIFLFLFNYGYIFHLFLSILIPCLIFPPFLHNRIVLEKGLPRHLVAKNERGHLRRRLLAHVLLLVLVALPQEHGLQLLLCLVGTVALKAVRLAVFLEGKHPVVVCLLPDELGLMVAGVEGVLLIFFLIRFAR